MVVKRDGVDCVIPLPKHSEEFERAPLGPSLDELRQEMLRLFKDTVQNI